MDILQKLENHEVLIIGDVMLDRYLTGAVSRISPEAPVPVVLHHATEDRLGGAANVALNVRALGGVPVLCSVGGSDEGGKILQRLLPAADITAEGIVVSAGGGAAGEKPAVGQQPENAPNRQRGCARLDGRGSAPFFAKSVAAFG